MTALKAFFWAAFTNGHLLPSFCETHLPSPASICNKVSHRMVTNFVITHGFLLTIILGNRVKNELHPCIAPYTSTVSLHPWIGPMKAHRLSDETNCVGRNISTLFELSPSNVANMFHLNLYHNRILLESPFMGQNAWFLQKMWYSHFGWRWRVRASTKPFCYFGINFEFIPKYIPHWLSVCSFFFQNLLRIH